ncbi:LytR/AlgR family response regulator transcription factor [Flavobacterium sp.]|uniref:LytR/AlgR family response regulator transcription factor n=1 Tax=Flavobacterium sp. TaxID=239 RepID=UPI0039E4B9F2
MNPWKCIIVDDEDVDRLMVVSFVKRFPSIEIAGIYKSAAEALAALQKEKIDVLFLDIDMPGGSGLELRQKATQVPACVFITGHAEYAVESFELDTLDFIVKPLRFERFEKAMQRVLQFLEIKEKATLFELSFGGDLITIKEGNEQFKVKLSDILYLEALKDYTLLVTPQKKHCVWSNIGTLLKKEPFDSFVRVHKSFAVQKQFVVKTSAHEITLANQSQIPIGRSYKENLSAIL